MRTWTIDSCWSRGRVTLRMNWSQTKSDETHDSWQQSRASSIKWFHTNQSRILILKYLTKNACFFFLVLVRGWIFPTSIRGDVWTTMRIILVLSVYYRAINNGAVQNMSSKNVLYLSTIPLKSVWSGWVEVRPCVGWSILMDDPRVVHYLRTDNGRIRSICSDSILNQSTKVLGHLDDW